MCPRWFGGSSLGIVWDAKGEIDNALKDYTEAIRLDPKQSEPYRIRGSTWDVKGELDNAVRDYTEAIRLDPKNGPAYNNLAWLRSTCNNDKYREGKQAIEYATKACELSGWNDAGTIDTLAAAYAESGDFTKASEWQTKAVSMVLAVDKKPACQSRLDLYKSGKRYLEASKR